MDAAIREAMHVYDNALERKIMWVGRENFRQTSSRLLVLLARPRFLRKLFLDRRESVLPHLPHLHSTVPPSLAFAGRSVQNVGPCSFPD